MSKATESITYKGQYSVSKEPWEMVFTGTKGLGFCCYIGNDEHELYFVMPGDELAPWVCPLVPTINTDKILLRFLSQTGLENFFWVPTGRSIENVKGWMVRDV
jgi:hypothetical protein